MRGARYVRLISWTLQSGSEHYGFIISVKTQTCKIYTYICDGSLATCTLIKQLTF
jgi:hypothetical protein